MIWKNIYGLVPNDEVRKDEEEKEVGEVEIKKKEDIYDDAEQLVDTIQILAQESKKNRNNHHRG
jgi:hypothetical protein